MSDIAAASAAFDNNDWATVLRLLPEPGDDEAALTMTALAAWWLDDLDASIAARERLFDIARRRGDDAAAASVALRLAWDSTIGRRDTAVARAWTARAAALLADLPRSADHVWLELRRGTLDGDGPESFAAARSTAAELGAFDAEMTALCLQGQAMVVDGDVEAGFRLMDEAALAACNGELRDPIAITFACCQLLGACSRVRDLDRARQWCDRIAVVCEDQNIGSVLTVSRCMYAPILIARGRYGEAEEILDAAMAHYGNARLPHHAAESAVWKARVRQRQGRPEDAEALVRRAQPHPDCRLVLAELSLDAGDARASADHARAFLRQLEDDRPIEQMEALEFLVRAESHNGDIAAARAAWVDLSRIAEALGTVVAQASVARARAAVARAAGNLDDAMAAVEDSADLFERGSAPYESASARLELADVLDELGRPADAARERARGEEVLGALRPTGDDGPLTARELEVLRLVALGFSNADIAERLVISPHTAHRHVANVLQKLRVNSRTAAVARASALGLI